MGPGCNALCVLVPGVLAPYIALLTLLDSVDFQAAPPDDGHE